jgi:predicted metal-dependent peptidase
MDNLKKRFSMISEQWFIIDPLYFTILCTHQLTPNNDIASLRSGKGRIEFNPQFIESISDKMLSDLLKIETIRILLKHPYQRQQSNKRIALLASNMTINEYFRNQYCLLCAQDIWKDPLFYRQCFEFYYHELYQLLFRQQNAISPLNENKSDLPPKYDNGGALDEDSIGDQDNDPNSVGILNDDIGGSPEEGNFNDPTMVVSSPVDNPEDVYNAANFNEEILQIAFENSQLWEEDVLITEHINAQIENAKNNFSWGTVPGDLKDEILASLNIKLDYRKILNSFRSSIISKKRCLTRMRPNRRYEFQFMGSRYQFTTKLMVAVDVSGSLNNEDLKKAYSVINRFFKYGIESCEVIQFDTEIKGIPISLKKARKTIEIYGRGGTSFQCVIDYITEHREYDGLIIITDGYAPVPERVNKTPTRILWLFNNEANFKQNHVQLLPIGKCGFLE